MFHKKIVCVDFDHTLVLNRYPFCENPNVELINFIKSHRDKYVWILYTCRKDKQLKYAVDYLKENFDLEFDYVNENTWWNIEKYGDTRKVYADYYIDSNGLNLGNYEVNLGP